MAAVAAAVELSAGATRVQLFPGYGTWRGRNGAGPYILTDQAHAERVIAATMAAMGPVDLSFDYDHQAALAAVPGVGGTAKAAGWFKSLTADADGIWAEGVDWTPAAAAAIEAREYRYASPFFHHDKQGRITRIVNAALTNIPNFDLAAIASAIHGEDDKMVIPPEILAALGLGADADVTAAVASITTLKGSTSLTSIASALGLDETADVAAIASAATIAKAAADAGPDPKAFVPVAVVEQMRGELVEINDDRAKSAIASATSEGKLTPAEHKWARDYIKDAGLAAFASMLANRPAILAPGAVEPKVDVNSDTVTDSEMAIASMLGVSRENFIAARKDAA